MTPYKALETALSEYIGRAGLMSYAELSEKSRVGEGILRRLGRCGDDYTTDFGKGMAILEALPAPARARFWNLQGKKPPRAIKGVPVPIKHALAAVTALAARMAAAVAKERPCHRAEAEIHREIPNVAAIINRVTLR